MEERAETAPRSNPLHPSYDHLHAEAAALGTGIEPPLDNAAIDTGWGRILMGHTFADPAALAAELCNETPGKRDIAVYVDKPHVVLSYAPQQLFLDPSDTLRLHLDTFTNTFPDAFAGSAAERDTGSNASEDAGNRADNGETGAASRSDLEVHRISKEHEAQAMNEIYLKRNMVPTDSEFVWRHRDSATLIFLVAVDPNTGAVLGTVTGVDHQLMFKDPGGGSSLWCLAVDPQAAKPGVGETLVRALATHFKHQGRRFMDLSVMHNNVEAKALYDKLGFEPVITFSVKNKNAYNESLFIGPEFESHLNPYARIIVDEARARGISVEVLDAEEGYFRLSRGGKSITCRESLSELTSSVAMSRCQDKYVTNRWLAKAGLQVPAFQLSGERASDVEFLKKHQSIVVKPATGEQGKGITVGIDNEAALEKALKKARQFGERVLLESYHPGEDLRVVVINYRVVAAAVRKPAQIIGDGVHDARTLIEKQSRRRQAATGGESRIPVDEETERCLAAQGFTLDSVIDAGASVTVRKTANLHTGGTIHDVTDILHPRLVDAAVKAARHLEIPVVGFDFLIQAPDKPEHVLIEANERVGLANHEPQPTAQRFVDLLFPLSRSAKRS